MSTSAQHVQALSGHHGGQPAAEVVDLFRVGVAQPQPGVLDGVVSLAERAEHPVGDRAEMRSVNLEFAGEHFLLIHVTVLFLRVSWK